MAPETRDASFGESVAMAQVASRWQARALGFEWPARQDPTPNFESPSQAVHALLDRYDATPTALERNRIKALDALEPHLAKPLTEVVEAFIEFERATTNAYDTADLQDLKESAGESSTKAPHEDHELWSLPGADETPSPGESFREADLQMAPVLAARNDLLDATVRLQHSIASQALATTTSTCYPTQVPPVFSFDLQNCGNTYTEDYALLLDAGGQDRYRNNAGGTGYVTTLGGDCTLLNDPDPTNQMVGGAAALLELGSSRDVYGTWMDSCGTTGGGYLGTGFLVDAGGDDQYNKDDRGINGGGFFGGMGFLLDAGGHDDYPAGYLGVNGGGNLAGVGFLLDAGGGQDEYHGGKYSGNVGSNGGGYQGGMGFLFDTGGNDSYSGGNRGVNGGGALGGQGFLLDAGGADVYHARSKGVNGGGWRASAGFLLDANGDDSYNGGHLGANGGGSDGGSGFLVDMGGSDSYNGGAGGVNGGGHRGGSGLLIDERGTDRYEAKDPTGGVNGGATTHTVDSGLSVPSSGALIDAGGQGDEYLTDEGSSVDETIVPKGTIGAQVDGDDPPP